MVTASSRKCSISAPAASRQSLSRAWFWRVTRISRASARSSTVAKVGMASGLRLRLGLLGLWLGLGLLRLRLGLGLRGVLDVGVVRVVLDVGGLLNVVQPVQEGDAVLAMLLGIEDLDQAGGMGDDVGLHVLHGALG